MILWPARLRLAQLLAVVRVCPEDLVASIATSGKIDPADAAGQIEIEGDRRLANDVGTMLAGSAR